MQGLQGPDLSRPAPLYQPSLSPPINLFMYMIVTLRIIHHSSLERWLAPGVRDHGVQAGRSPG